MLQLLDPRQPICHRLMLFLLPEPTIAETIERKCHTDWAPGHTGDRLPRDRLHVTTCLFGNFQDRPDRLVDTIRAAADHVRFMPFWMDFDWIGSFGAGNNRPRVLAGSEMDSFHCFRKILREILAGAGVSDLLRPRIDPHITLFYERTAIPGRRIDPIGWTVREFVLVDSLVGLTRHEVLGRWTLNDPLMSSTVH